MSVIQRFALGLGIWVALGSSVRADAITNAAPNIWFFYGGAGQSSSFLGTSQASVTNASNGGATIAYSSTPFGFTPAPAPAPAESTPAPAASAPVPAAQSTSSPWGNSTFGASSAPSGQADAFLNFGNGPYPDANTLTTGGAQPWYTSPVVAKFYGGQAPNAQQQTDFENAVLKDVQTTYQLSGGLAPKLTIDPTVPANHTVSEVSNTSYGPNSNAIGITNVGGNGFGFIDKLTYAQSLDQLEWAVAHNLSHELMHAFGVAVHHDQTGQYLDAATANWSVLTDPNATFSPAAIQDIASHNYAPNPSGQTGAELIDGDQTVQPVPEPATLAIWGLAAAGLVAMRRRSLRLRVQ